MPGKMHQDFWSLNILLALIVILKLINCVITLSGRQFSITLFAMGLYAFVEILNPGLVQPIDRKVMINMPQEVPLLTVLILIISVPVFVMLRAINRWKLCKLGAPFDEALLAIDAQKDANETLMSQRMS
jgi:hypothetical protein